MIFIEKIKEIEKKKKNLFFFTSSAGLFMYFFFSPIIGIPLFFIGIIIGINWFKFRAKNGLRF